MTNHTTAARAVKQETVLTTGQILGLERRSNMTEDEALRFARAIESALLSKLRAPVADERAAFEKCYSAIIKAISSIARADGPDTRREDDPELVYRSPVMDDVVRIRVALDECSAAQASAPVAGEAQPVAWMTEDGSDAWTDAKKNQALQHAGKPGARLAASYSVPLTYAAPQASEEPLARYCPGCGSVGPVRDEYRDCCPDGNQARMIPVRLAEKCRDTFRLAIKSLLADAEANDSGAPQASEAVPIGLLATEHTGMRVDYSGLLKQARSALEHGETEPALAEMLRQLAGHLEELGQRWYAGDVAVVDELLQLYCVESEVRAALSAQPGAQKDGGAVYG